jgi:hypothetical protein
MNREEVIQLMHRELDGDLTAAEKKILLSYVKSSSEFKAIFEKLKHLSSQLEALPKVKPPISIVDKIMPEIDAYEKQRNQGIVADKEQKKDLEVEDISSKQAHNKLKRRLWFPGTVVAAAGILGIIWLGNLFNDPSASNLAENPSYAEMTPFAFQNENIRGDSITNASESNEMGIMGNNMPEAPKVAEQSGGMAVLETPENQSENGQPTLSDPPQPKDVSEEKATVPPAEADRENEATENEASTEQEEGVFPSPNGVFVARLGITKEDLFMNKNGAPYSVVHSSNRPWLPEQIEWISDSELYFVLYNQQDESRQYFLYEPELRKKTELDEPLQRPETESNITGEAQT